MSSAESADDLLRRSVESCLGEVCTSEHYAAAEAGVIAAPVWNAIDAAGLPLLFLTEEQGGLGLSDEQAFQLLKSVGRFGAPFPIAETALANAALARAGMAIAEGPAAIVPRTNALTLTDGVLRGTARRIAWGAAAQVLVVDLDDAVARVGAARAETGANVAGAPRNTVMFDADADVGSYSGMPLRLMGSVARCVMMAGALERVLELTLEHVSGRVQFGRPLSKFQAVQQQVAMLAAEYAAANAAADLATQGLARGRSAATFANAVARTRIGEAASRAAAIAHQLHGAMGFTQEHMLQRLTRALWSWRDEFGSQRYWTLQVAKHAFAFEADEYWARVVAA